MGAGFIKNLKSAVHLIWLVPHFLRRKTAGDSIYITLFWQNGGSPFSAAWLPERVIREIIFA